MIRKDDILKATDKGIHVFRHYLGKDFKVGKNFLNPFYRDTKASCNIYYDRKAGVFKMKDFGNEDERTGLPQSERFRGNYADYRPGPVSGAIKE